MPSEVRSEPPPRLDPPDRRPLEHPPVELVIFELLLLGGPPAVTSKDALVIKRMLQAIGWHAERVEPAQRRGLGLKVVDGEPEVVIGEEASGWSLIAADGSVTVSVFPAAVTAQINNYRSWGQSLAPGLAIALEAVGKILDPSGVQRVGLRYVNRLVDRAANEPGAWRGCVSTPLLGPVLHEVLGPVLVSAQQQVDLAWSTTEKGVLRHGPFKDGSLGGSLSYLLDIDISDAGSGTFDTARVLSVADGLHLRALSVFQASLTSEYLAALRGDEA
ncbi:TIGR04255 family protein [Streptomyces fuscichromogenes]|uniref:TIGR04255 family protein n=1 Tax=Streptomyces fuscichromogenes TaxID=1324013 RepID=UPI0037FE8189